MQRLIVHSAVFLVSQIVEEVEHSNITGNILNGTNNGSGAFTGIISSAAVATANINNNIIRSHSRSQDGALLLFRTGPIAELNINENQLGNTDGGIT
jgi:triosephosphate isomerase